jgi:hypothetical protein
MLQKLKTGACCVLLIAVMAAHGFAADSTEEEASPFDPAADKILRSADAYIKAQQSLKMEAETMLDIVSEDGQIVTYTTRIDVSVARPDKLYAKRVGVIRNQEIFYNGKELVLHSLKHNVYAKEEVQATIGGMLDFATTRLGLQAPGRDLLYFDLYDGMMSAAVSGTYLGKVKIDDVECHHLAYRCNEVDFQFWIEAGKEAKPKRYMIISKLLPSAPRYMINIKSLEPAKFSNKTFEFSPSTEDKQIHFLTEEEIAQLKQAVKEAK